MWTCPGHGVDDECAQPGTNAGVIFFIFFILFMILTRVFWPDEVGRGGEGERGRLYCDGIFVMRRWEGQERAFDYAT